MGKLNLSEYAIVSDFDGTITIGDSTDDLAEILGTAENTQTELDYIAGRISTRLTMAKHFEHLQITLDEYYSFLDSHARVDPAFDDFLHIVSTGNTPFSIVSGGYWEAILRLLGERRLQGVTVYASRLHEERYLSPVFGHELYEIDCAEQMGPCGICKKLALSEIRRSVNRKLMYIGDGLTDRCAVRYAQFVFAKNALEAYCIDENIPYVHFDTFADICAYLR